MTTFCSVESIKGARRGEEAGVSRSVRPHLGEVGSLPHRGLAFRIAVRLEDPRGALEPPLGANPHPSSSPSHATPHLITYSVSLA